MVRGSRTEAGGRRSHITRLAPGLILITPSPDSSSARRRPRDQIISQVQDLADEGIRKNSAVIRSTSRPMPSKDL
jgi:hypothetical protein